MDGLKLSRRTWFGAVTAILGCGGANKPVGKKFGVVFQTMNNPFFVELDDGVKAIVEAHGDAVVTVDSQFDALKQKNDVADLLLRGVAGIFLNPVDWEGVRPSLQKAKEKGVPIVIVDAPVRDKELVLCQVASDNVEAGRLACRRLAAKQPNAQVVVLDLPANKACLDRVEGFTEESKKHPGIKILATQVGKGTTEGALPVMRDMIGRYPNLTAAFPINDPSAFGCVAALEAAGKLKAVDIVTVDGSADGAKAIKAGKILSSSAQFPREIGRKAAEAMYEHLAGKAPPAEIKVRVELVDAGNVDKFLPKS
jgi:ribose transport system substrate-binding protein